MKNASWPSFHVATHSTNSSATASTHNSHLCFVLRRLLTSR